MEVPNSAISARFHQTQITIAMFTAIRAAFPAGVKSSKAAAQPAAETPAEEAPAVEATEGGEA